MGQLPFHQVNLHLSVVPKCFLGEAAQESPWKVVYKNNKKNRFPSLTHRGIPIREAWDEALESVSNVWWFWPAARARNHSFLVHNVLRFWKVYWMSCRSKLLDVSYRREFYNLRKLFFPTFLLILRHYCHSSGRWYNEWTRGHLWCFTRLTAATNATPNLPWSPHLLPPPPPESLFQVLPSLRLMKYQLSPLWPPSINF